MFLDIIVLIASVLLACFFGAYNLFVFPTFVILRQTLDWFYPRSFNVKGKHLLITGGSSGLGLAIAKYYVQHGAKVTILARDMKKLRVAKASLTTLTDDATSINCISCDVIKYDDVKNAIENAIKTHGQPIDHLICAAGRCVPGFLADQPIQVHKDSMDLNYFGVLNTVKAALDGMTQHALEIQNKHDKPRICLISSALGLFSFTGQTSYAPTKFALRGLAETLHNELISYGIKIHIFFPGNIDTPGYEAENKVKPAITKKLEDGSTLSSPESVCSSLLQGMARGQHAIVNEIGVGILRIAAGGVMPRKNVFYDLIMLPLITVIGLIYRSILDYQVRKTNK